MQLSGLLGLLLSLATLVESAKILAIFPDPGPSQYMLVEPLLKSLAARGHELTVMSHFPQKQKLPNFRDIKLTYKASHEDHVKKLAHLGGSAGKLEQRFRFSKSLSIFTLENPQAQALLHCKDEHFDLVIVEVLHTEVLFAIAAHFQAHLIGFSSTGTFPSIDALFGNPSPVSYTPLVTSALTDRMNFWQRLKNLQLITAEWLYIKWQHMPDQERLYKKYFPHLKMELRDICKNFSLMLLNQHFSLSFPRPYVPAMIEVGGMHISHKPAPLPKDIANFINGSEHGVIYFSLGSHVKSKNFPQKQLDALLNVFGRLKQRIIWKFELATLPGKPDNVFISKWLPQTDILAHPNVKLFITHAGLLSTIEAIHHAKPVVGMPVFYDQFMNMERVRLMGIGVGVNYLTFTATDLMAAIQEVLRSPKYQEAVYEISARFHDQPIKPMDKAIYWIEYVLRHKGAQHMRVAALDLSFIEYYSLDTWGYLLVFWGLLPFIFVALVLKWLIRGLDRLGDGKRKRKGE